jgi:ribosomal protein S18 acetylase RimI-like enzyme
MTPQSQLTLEPVTVTPIRHSDQRLTTQRLTEEHKTEALKFLEERPLETFVMNGLIRDNGIESILNRGTFYGCRSDEGKLEGVALLGHAVFIDAPGGKAKRLFADVARKSRKVHMIMGEKQTVEKFWTCYSAGGLSPRLAAVQVLLELKVLPDAASVVPNLRRARISDLEILVPVHASLARIESGVNPLSIDPVGFRMRCRRRIEQDRIWVWIDQGRLIFKADIISETPHVFYIEGVYVDPEMRRQGYGVRCLADMCRALLRQTGSVCVLVNEAHRDTLRVFEKVGFVRRGLQLTIFL